MSFAFDIKGVENMLSKVKRRLPRVTTLAGREACITAGPIIKESIIAHIPTLNPKWILNNMPGEGRKMEQPWSSLRYSGEAKDTLYFTYSHKDFDFNKGRLHYIVGMGHGSGKKGVYNKGWFMPFLEFGHYFVNHIVTGLSNGEVLSLALPVENASAAAHYPAGDRKKIRKDRKKYRSLQTKVRWIPAVNGGRGFMQPGFAAAKSRAYSEGIRAAEAKGNELLKEIGR